ncbi:MAG: Fibronectin type III domain protein [candidate division WS6 bacterium OLB20]|uniref:Fibronectin type III domain protein n=1 Tax=candidate division WS6 bacterium OLB20 TaxID=1617426 RepID=A0A136LZH6_9BACT|nr:MAG: Fibronectin type III domain protein [candidate division WS6 bacterium OLB20]
MNKETSDILDAKALSVAGPKQLQDMTATVQSWLRGDAAGIMLQASDLETDADVTLSDITIDLVYTVPDSTDPVLNQLEIFEIGSKSVKFYWELSEPAEVTIDYGKTSRYGETETVDMQGLFHEHLLDGLSPGLTYHYKVTVTDAAGNKTTTRNSTFTTSLDSNVLGAQRTTVSRNVLLPPSILALEINPEDVIRTVHITWKNLTDKSIDGFILYRSSDEGASYREVKRVGAETLSMEDAGISPNTTYYYAIRSISSDSQSELSSPLAIYVPEVIADPVRISQNETVDAIGRTTLVIVAAAG